MRKAGLGGEGFGPLPSQGEEIHARVDIETILVLYGDLDVTRGEQIILGLPL